MLKSTSDRKTKFTKTQRNTFGLQPGPAGTCPGCTEEEGGCWYIAPGRVIATCYVDKLLRAYSGVRGVLEHNTDLLRNASYDEMCSLLAEEFARFERTSKPEHRHYRLHWSGDVFSETYAHALADTMRRFPSISFWGYTRSAFAIPILLPVKNLVLYLSADPQNVLPMISSFAACGGGDNDRLRIAYMSKTDDFEAEVRPWAIRLLDIRARIYRLYGEAPESSDWLSTFRLVPCPVDRGKMELEFGCSTCRLCLGARPANIWFES